MRQLSMDELRQMAAGMFGDLVKAVVDVDMELLAVDAELYNRGFVAAVFPVPHLCRAP